MRKSENSCAKVIRRPCISTGVMVLNFIHNNVHAYVSLRRFTVTVEYAYTYNMAAVTP